MVWPQHELGQSGTISTSPRALPTDAELMFHVFCTVRNLAQASSNTYGQPEVTLFLSDSLVSSCYMMGTRPGHFQRKFQCKDEKLPRFCISTLVSPSHRACFKRGTLVFVVAVAVAVVAVAVAVAGARTK
jgi:hypothetical protein